MIGVFSHYDSLTIVEKKQNTEFKQFSHLVSGLFFLSDARKKTMSVLVFSIRFRALVCKTLWFQGLTMMLFGKSTPMQKKFLSSFLVSISISCCGLVSRCDFTRRLRSWSGILHQVWTESCRERVSLAGATRLYFKTVDQVFIFI